MLEGIDRNDWSNIYGPYGPVPEMPQFIRGLTSADPIVSDAALSWLGNNLIHQGTRWQSTPAAIPFILEVLAQSTTLNRERIIILLLNLAVDGTVPPLPEGFNPDQEFADVKGVRIDPADVMTIWRADDWDKLDTRLWNIVNMMPRRDHYDTYLAVERGTGLLARLTMDPIPAVRRASLWSLGWFPTAAEHAVNQVRVAFARETDEYMVANMFIILGILARYLKDRTDVPCLEIYLGPKHARIIRRAAALALIAILGTEISTLALEVLISGTEDEEYLARDTTGLGWPGDAPSLRGCYWRAIHSLGL